MQKTFVITGTLSNPRQHYIDLIEGSGHKVSSSVTSKTDYLLVGQDAGSKLDKARSLGVWVIDEEDLYDVLDALKPDALMSDDVHDEPPGAARPRIIRHVFVCGEDEDLGECEAMFDGKTLIGWWHCNDATWRNEYFSPFMKSLGVIVKSSSPTPSDISAIRRYLGLDK